MIDRLLQRQLGAVDATCGFHNYSRFAVDLPFHRGAMLRATTVWVTIFMLSLLLVLLLFW